jgi:L-aminopeptidase/D-esterase-like protein
VAKAFGIAGAVKGGIGSARCVLADGVSVGAAVAVNAWGGVCDHRDGSLIAGPRRQDGRMADPVEVMLTGETSAATSLLVNTTIGVVATDAALDKMQVNFVASSAHDGLALTIRPCHTPSDGDTMFCVATGRNRAPADLMTIVAAATQVTALAVIDAVRSATGLAGVPAVRELENGAG